MTKTAQEEWEDEGIQSDKMPMDLIAPEIMVALSQVLRYGAKKYAPRNWEKGMDWSRVFGAAQRHLWAWWAREDKDAETALSHLAHAACCVMFLIAYEERECGSDDRPRRASNKRDRA